MIRRNTKFVTGMAPMHGEPQVEKRMKPATLALFVQLIAADLVLPFASQYILMAVIAQGILASFLAYLWKMPVWWRVIHFLFPPAVFLMYQAHLPSTVYLVAFLVTLAWYWTTFRTQVPFYPSNRFTHQLVAGLVPKISNPRIIDIGSGVGDLAMFLAKVYPKARVEGIEIAPLPWLVSRIRAIFSHSSAGFKLGDYTKLNFADYDVVFAYLSPAAMPSLWKKAKQEMRQGSLLLSNEFEIPGVKPTQILQPPITESAELAPLLFVWRI